MSSNPSFNAPVLNYVGSVDVASATSGSTLYNILFDSSLCTIGNILMFEYKIQPSNVSVPDPDNITLGYVNVENAIFNSGIQNQWTIAVPASNHIYDPPVEQEISVRVYSGLTGTTEIAVSPWSNTLAVHVPPPQPIINFSVFNQNQLSSDDLWVYMTPTVLYDYSSVSFIVAYYFQDVNGDTVWSVSDPLQASNVTIGNTLYKQLEIRNIGNVNTYPNVVYVAIYAVYPFVNNSENYYSVSEISDTYAAQPASNLTAPTITSLNYNVYNTPFPVPGDQTMVVSWTAPASSGIPYYTVSRYVLQRSINSGTWTNVDTNIPSNTLTYTANVFDASCGQNIAFRVFAISTSGAESALSNVKSLNKFVYSLPPRNLNIASISRTSGLVNATITFQNPTNIGCGAGYQYVVQFSNLSGVQETRYVPYNAATTTYTIPYTGLNISSVGTVSVYLETVDTNQSGSSTIYRNSESVTVPYIVSFLTLNPIDYQVYTNGTQNMILTWNNPTSGLTGWGVSSYQIYLNLNDGSGNQLISTITNGATTYTYNAQNQSCEQTLTFYIVANLTNSGTNFTITSNSQSINIFKYATAPTSVMVDWASSDISQNIVDLALTFNVANPYNAGCGSIINWVVNVTDSTGTTILKTTNVTYVPNQTSYLVFVDDVQYVENGMVYVFMQTQDTNNNGVTRDGESSSSSFTSSGLPIFRNVSINQSRTQLSFEVYTQTPLGKFARFFWATYNNGIINRNQLVYTNTLEATPNKTLVITPLPNNVLKYTFTFSAEYFLPLQTIPTSLTLTSSNNVGINFFNTN